VCNRTKLQHWQPFGELHLTDTPEEWWDVISVGFPSNYQTPMGMILSWMLSIVWVNEYIVSPLTPRSVQKEWLYYFFREVWKHHGLPRAVLSDQGPQFITKFMRELYRILGLNPQLQYLITHRPMARLNILTKSSKDTFESSLPSTRAIWTICFLQLNSHTITMCIHWHSIPPLWSILGDTLTWASNLSRHNQN
jgi:hypothetical protein